MRPARRLATWLVPALGVAALAVTAAGDQPGGTDRPLVTAEFRVFDGTEEVTGRVRLRVMPSGERTAATELSRPSAQLPPAVYDVQALHEGDDGVVAIKWAERLTVMHYPDESAGHLQVINLRPGFGALQLRVSRGTLPPDDVAIFAADDPTAPAGRAVAGDGYVLFVVPAGRYDVRVNHAVHGGSPDSHWLTHVEVPADGTRLKVVEAPDP